MCLASVLLRIRGSSLVRDHCPAASPPRGVVVRGSGDVSGRRTLLAAVRQENVARVGGMTSGSTPVIEKARPRRGRRIPFW
jgi:hypothetical protein